MKILHIAPFNTAGVPITLVKAERSLGHESRLITLGRDRRNYEEDVCLSLPFLDHAATRLAKRFFSEPSRTSVDNKSKSLRERPPVWLPRGGPERLLVRLRERLWQRAVVQAQQQVNFWNFDVYQLDGGLEFFRDGRTVTRLKELRKRVICAYTGSDLRTRGVIPNIDVQADLRVTFEFDHLQLHPDIQHVFFPFDVEAIEQKKSPDTGGILRIGHAPTNRKAKGSDEIIAAIRALASEHPVELLLIENQPHQQALRLKADCDVFVDQIGDLGYGINSLESLAMGIPTCSSLAPGFADSHPDHPFVVIDENNIQHRLLELVQDANLREVMGQSGRRWVQRNHDSTNVVRRIHAMLDEAVASERAGALS